MTISPAFVLSGPAGTLVAEGIQSGYDDVHTAERALRDGTVDLIVGALPFDVRRPAALMAPITVQDRLPHAQAATLPRVRIAGARPEPAVHRSRIEAALRLLRDPQKTLEKVVLARALDLAAQAALDPTTVLHRLLDADPGATGYLVDLSTAGTEFTGHTLVGASPELLVARWGDEVACQPFAGSAPRSPTEQADAASGAALAASAKNRHEHQLVVDAMREALQPLCSHLEVVDEPQLSGTSALWHLSTPIRGRLRQTSTTAIDLALALHPTPAVGGVPTAAAVDTIAELEGDRGFYAGTAGWCDGRGDGRWVVTIRGAELAPDRCSAVARAGGGIVAESDADDEIDETTTKFRTILTALGVPT